MLYFDKERLLYKVIVINGKPINAFFNTLLDAFEDADLGFLGTVLFGLLSFYLLAAAFKGNVKFGLRFFCITFYPMV